MKSNFGLFYVFFGSFYHLSTVPREKQLALFPSESVMKCDNFLPPDCRLVFHLWGFSGLFFFISKIM